MPLLRYELQVWGAGVQSTTGAPAFTLRAPLGVQGFRVPGQIVRPLEGRAESQSWQLTVVDVGSTFTAKLASTAGRLWLLNRLARLRVAQDSTASSAYQPVAVARITDVNLTPNVAEYQLTLNDERYIERNTELFGRLSAPTCMVYPAGLLVDWNGIRREPPQNCSWRKGFLLFVPGAQVWQFAGTASHHASAHIAQAIIADLDPTAPWGTGAFHFLRYRDFATGKDYEIATFDFSPTGGPFSDAVAGLPTIIAFWRDGSYQRQATRIAVLDPAGELTGSQRQGCLLMPNAPPSLAVPFHLGGANGQHPFAIAQQIYAGTYTASTGLRVRHDPAAFTALQAEPKYGRVNFRITEPVRMAQFLEERIYAPFNVAPLLDSSGRVTPTPLHLPQNTDPAHYPLLTSTNLRAPHPTFAHPLRETVTTIVFQAAQYRRLSDAEIGSTHRPEFAADRIEATTALDRRTHDTLGALGTQERRFQLPVFPQQGLYGPIGPPPPGNPNTAKGIATLMTRELFDRYGDGPAFTDAAALPSVDATTNGKVKPGDFVRLQLATYPNAALNARGGTRFLQVLSRGYEPQGPTFTLLDAGPNLQPTTTPSLALARSSQSTRHAVKVTITPISGGASYLTQLALSSNAATTSPASTRWFPAVGVGTSLSFHVGGLPAGYKVFGRAQSAKPGRVRSAFSAVATVTLAGLNPPTSPKTTERTAGTARLRWRTGTSGYPVGIYLKNSTAAGLTSTQLVATLPAGSTNYKLEGLTANTPYRWGVAHVDPYGGRSVMATTTFQTTTTFGVAPPLRGIRMLRAGLT